MPEESFKKQFSAIGFNLARKTKKQVKSIQKNKKELIKKTNYEFAVGLIKEIKEMTNKSIREYEYELNQKISDNIKAASERVLHIKNQLLEDLFYSIKQSIKDKISSNRKGYLEFLVKNLEKYVDIFQESIVISLNLQDQELFNQIKERFPEKNFILNQEAIDSIGGFFLTDVEKTIIIESTIDNYLQKNSNLIKQKFAKIFPEYIDIRKSATQLIRERNIEKLFELPKQLQDFIKNNNLEIEM